MEEFSQTPKGLDPAQQSHRGRAEIPLFICHVDQSYVIKSSVDAVRNTSVVVRIPHVYAGLILIAVFWPLNWLLPDETRRTSYLFFPLWVGYALTMDALVLARSGTSILSRSRRDFIWLFFTSAPAWW